MPLQDDIDTIKNQLSTIDADTTKLADATTAIQTRVTGLLSQIPAATTLQEASDLAAQATTEVGKLGTVTDALTALGAPAA